MKDLNHGLDLLADEATPAPVDVQDVIAKARARTRNRRASAATALATVAAVAAIAVTIGDNGHGNGVNAATQTSTTTAPPATATVCPQGAEKCGEFTGIVDAQSRKLTEQLVAARDTVIPMPFTVERSGFPLYDNIDPLEFVVWRAGEPYYQTYAKLTDSEGSAELSIEVIKLAPGTPLGHVYSLPLAPCTPGEGNCEERTLPDGTVARAQTSAHPPGMIVMNYMAAVRPDGTYISVTTSTPQGTSSPRSTLPLTIDDLFRFATVFTY